MMIGCVISYNCLPVNHKKYAPPIFFLYHQIYCYNIVSWISYGVDGILSSFLFYNYYYLFCLFYVYSLMTLSYYY